MALISASLSQLGFVTEVDWGTTPATPVWQILRFTPPENFKADRENTSSNEMRPDRNATDLIQVGGGASGGFGFELSYGTYDTLLESFFQSAWANDVLKNGVTPKTFSFERKMPTGAATAEYFRFTGMQGNSLSISCKAKEVVSGTMDFVGKAGAVASAIVSGATYNDPSTTEVFSPVADFAALSVGGVSTAHVLGLTFQANNNLRAPSALGSVDAIGIGSGKFEVTGTIDVYFEDTTLYAKYLSGDAIALEFTIGSTTANKYTFSMANIKLETAEAPVSGPDDDLIMNFSYRALYDSTDECTLMITRAVA